MEVLKFLPMTLQILLAILFFILPILQNYFFHYQCEPLKKWRYIASYDINSCISITLNMGRGNKREYFPGPWETSETGGPESFRTDNKA